MLIFFIKTIIEYNNNRQEGIITTFCFYFCFNKYLFTLGVSVEKKISSSAKISSFILNTNTCNGCPSNVVFVVQNRTNTIQKYESISSPSHRVSDNIKIVYSF